MISIILPTYNVEKYIARALETCINQTFKDIEIIVVDDCGSDKSIDIAKEYASKDDRIKIIHNEENLGTFASRNIGVLNSSSPYIMFLDPDDYLELNACEECIYYIKNDIDITWFNFLYDENKNYQKNSLFDQILTIKEYCKYIFSMDLCYWNLCSKLIKKEVYIHALQKIEDYKKNLTMAEDALMYFFIIIHCKKIATSSKHIYYYCINQGSSTLCNNIKKIKRYLEDETYIVSTMKAFLKNNNIDKNLYYFCNILMYDIAYWKNHRKELYIKNTNKILWKIFFKYIIRTQRKHYMKKKKTFIKLLNV
ncbi:glycosyltransferase family 2 protein [Campylobacter lari]|nr:glycosyltransferase family 2 protein [Campylobacter lari]